MPQDSDSDKFSSEETKASESSSVVTESQESAKARPSEILANEAKNSGLGFIALAAKHVETADPIYGALNDNTKSLRLLSFQAADGMVSGKLEQFDDVEKCPPFVALSYTWGPEWPVETIELNGWRFQVRRNLYNFLDNLRHARYAWAKQVYGDDAPTAVTENKYLENPILWDHWWIDAICIDQNSIEEKNHQVGIMNDIYSQAKFVFVWLGTALEVEIEMEKFVWMQKVQDDIASRSAKQDAASMIDPLTCTEVTHVLLQNKYWTRLWIVQEFVLAQDLLLCAGDFVFRWKDFRDSILDLERKLRIGNANLDNLMEQRYHREHGDIQRLSGLIRKFCLTQCADPRDRVFGLLGLSKTSLKADYEQSAHAVFLGVLKVELETISTVDEFDALRSFCLRELRIALEINPYRAEELFDLHGMSPSRHINTRISRYMGRMHLM